MKKAPLLILILILASGLTANAQVEKGKLFIAGSNSLALNAGVHKDEVDGQLTAGSQESYFNFEFQPRAGYMFIDNLAAGLFIDYNFNSSKNQDGSGYQTIGNTIIAGPFARYYIHFCDKLIPFVEAETGFGIDHDKDTQNSGGDWNKTNQTVFSYRLGGGATLFFNDIVGLDAFIGFNHESRKQKIEEEGASRSDHNESFIYNEFLMQMGIVVMLGK